MGQLRLADLGGLGRAAARAIAWLRIECPDSTLEALDEFFRALAAARGDSSASNATPPPGMRQAGGSWGTSEDSWWQTQLWTNEEFARSGSEVAWCLVIGWRHQYFTEIHVSIWLQDEPFTVVVKLDPRDRTGEMTPMPELLKWARGRRNQLPDFRRTAQGIDALSRYVTVTIDPAWKEDHIREAVMAQVAEWFTRVAGSPDARLPRLESDVYEWWLRWAKRTARVDGPDERSLADLFEVAKRSVRPASAPGHRLYWKKSFTPRSDDLLIRVAAEVGISRRTAYARLLKGGRRLADFLSYDDPFLALEEFLKAHAPLSRLPEERRTLISLLRESGMKSESSRKLERRIRHLPASDQEARVRSAIRRVARRGV